MDTQQTAKAKPKAVSKNVVIMGLVSLFNDISSEMIYPIVPIFLTTVLYAPATAVGLIEGVAESSASLLKMVSGWLSDRLQKRKISGYWKPARWEQSITVCSHALWSAAC